MDNPYGTPVSHVADAQAPQHLWTRPVIAFTSGILLLPMLAVAVIFASDKGSASYGNFYFWGSVAVGSVVAGLVSLRFPRMPVWLAILLGPLSVLLTIVVVIVSAFSLGMIRLSP
ncbi:hypothetical protein GCM10027084_28520 [Pseudoxanthomonas sangjuensis]|uniref:hypothetical protein n=1 Tax=Pseudoxanthomonas sangjuensis TaxID=1503750 RepID=UPI001390B811|nr:hypothetical protein [Pseudoxanthomonas sangjuensis]